MINTWLISSQSLLLDSREQREQIKDTLYESRMAPRIPYSVDPIKKKYLLVAAKSIIVNGKYQ